MDKGFDIFTDRRNTGSCKWEAFSDLVYNGECIPLTVADMEMPIAQPIKNALIRAAEHGICGYTEPDAEYIDALSGFMKRRHGIDLERKNLLCTMGIVPAFGIIIRALTEVGDGIILQPPVYTPFFDAVKLNSRKVIENQLLFDGEKYVMDFEHFEKCCKGGAKLFMLCSPHNPVGRVWTYEELQRVCNICKKYNVLIVSDEIHNDIMIEGKHISTVTLPEMNNNVITCTAMSKTFNLAGLMLSNILVFNDDIYRKLDEQVSRDGSHCIPYFGRAAAIAAFTQCDEWIDELCEYLHGNFELCYSFVKNNMPTVKCIHAEGTYLLWLDCRKQGISDEERNRRFLDEGVPVNVGTMFGSGGSGFVRINIALPRAELEKALIKIERVINK